jgi:hypothetical protein
MPVFRRVALLFAVAAACAPARVSVDDPHVVLQRAMDFHGTPGAQVPVEVVIRGDRTMIDQSRAADPPWDKEPSLARVAIDEAGSRFLWEGSTSYPGLGAFGMRRVFSPAASFEIDPSKGSHGSVVMSVNLSDAAEARREVARYLPSLVLSVARENSATLTVSAPEPGTAGSAALTYRPAAGRDVTLHFEGATGALRKTVTRRVDAVYGPIVDSVVYAPFVRHGGLPFPARWREYQDTVVVRDLPYEVRVGALPDSMWAVPAGFAYPSAGVTQQDMMGSMNHEAGMRPVANGVFVESGSGTLVVELRDYLVAFDCPNDYATGRSTLQAIQRAFPGKAVRFLVASHTHPDHCGGARPFFEAGSTVIAAKGHRAFYERLAAIDPGIAIDTYRASTRAPAIETLAVNETRVLTDGIRRIELTNVGANPHTTEAVLALVPHAGLLWQVDFFLPPMMGPLTAGRPVSDWLAREVERRGWRFSQIIDTHMGIVHSLTHFNEALTRSGFAPVRFTR